MPTAFNLVPHRFADGRQLAIMDGLRAAGFKVVDYGHRRGSPPGPWLRPDDERDVLVTWTVHRGALEACRDFFERHGGQVIVAEEAHIRHIRNGPWPADQYFSLCLHEHQDMWRVGGLERWASWNIELRPWRATGRKVLVREQRGIGSRRMASPPGWHVKTAGELQSLTDRPIEIVTHPKTLKRRGKRVPANEDLFADVHCVVTWASHMGTQALLHGVPVVFYAPRFFLANAAACRQWHPILPARPPAFERFAWAQWAMSEIRSGAAFVHLLGPR